MFKFLTSLALAALLFSLGEPAHANMTCAAFLQDEKLTKIDLNYSEIVRRPESLSHKVQNSALLKNYENNVIKRSYGLQPHARSQCMGTCYIYAGQIMIEGALKANGIIPVSSFLLTAPALGSVALSRIPFSESRPSASKVLTGGTAEALHSIAKRKAYFVTLEEISNLGGSLQLSKLESDFLKVFVELQTFKFEGRTFDELMLFDSKLDETMAKAFVKYVQIVTKQNIRISTVPVKEVQYSQLATFTNTSDYFLEGHISTLTEKTVTDVANEYKRASKQSSPLPQDAFVKRQTDFSKNVVPFLVRHLQAGRLVNLAVRPEVFGEAHAVTVTNLVVDQSTNTLIGFVYLNSHSVNFGVRGYGFLHAAEVAKYISDATVITQITKSKPILSLTPNKFI